MNYVNANGEPLDIGYMEQIAKATRRIKPKAEGPAEFHKGWRVQGHPPGAMEAAQAEAERLLSLWNAQSEQDKAEAIKQGERAPAAWSGRNWRMTTKKRPVRSKPYEIPEAARQCAELATKAGWLDIEVAELKKSKNG